MFKFVMIVRVFRLRKDACAPVCACKVYNNVNHMNIFDFTCNSLSSPVGVLEFDQCVAIAHSIYSEETSEENRWCGRRP